MKFDSPTGQGIVYAYNAAKLLASETSFGRTVSFQYDPVYNRTRLTWPDSQYVQYDYDALNRVWKVRENGASSGVGVLATYTYDPLSRRTNLGRGNSTTTTYGYDLASRLTSLNQNLGATAYDAVFTLGYTLAGQLASRQSTNGLLGSWTVPPRSDTYATANGRNQYTTVAGRTYTHDANGNLTTNGLRSYGYDVENRLTSVTGSPATTLTYDPLGRLRQTVAGSVTTQFLYDGDRLIAEYNGTGSLLRRYVHGPGVDEPLVWYEGAALTDRRWLHTDERGSVVAQTNGSGTATPYSYGPYGEPEDNDWTGSRFRYTGQITLPEAQLYHYKARVYDPIDGRFLQTDPIGYADDHNLYAYVANDPTNRTDPTGTEGVGCWNNGQGCGAEVGIAARAAYVGVRSEQVRADYNRQVAKLDPSDSAARTGIKAEARASTPPEVRAAVEARRPELGPTEGSGATANRSSSGASQTAKVLGAVGKGSVVVTATLGVAEIALSENPGRAAAGVTGAAVGGVAFGEGGAAAGAVIGGFVGGPPGAAIGAVVGGIGGSMFGGYSGHSAGTNIYDMTQDDTPPEGGGW